MLRGTSVCREVMSLRNSGCWLSSKFWPQMPSSSDNQHPEFRSDITSRQTEVQDVGCRVNSGPKCPARATGRMPRHAQIDANIRGNVLVAQGVHVRYEAVELQVLRQRQIGAEPRLVFGIIKFRGAVQEAQVHPRVI